MRRYRLALPASHLSVACLACLAASTACGAGEPLGPVATGQLAIVTATQGSTPDPDGFLISVDDGLATSVDATDTLTLEGLTPAEHRVALAGLAANCTVNGQNPASALVVARLLTTIRFEVDCTAPTSPTGTLQVFVSTSGENPDPDGYSIFVDTAEPVAARLADTVVVSPIAVGAHAVRLAGLAANCTVNSDNPASVTILAGEVQAAAFEVRCWPPLAGRIALSRVSTEFFTSRIEVINSLRTSEEFFFTRPDRASRPAWSPDGVQLAYIGESNSDFVSTVWVNLDGFDEVRLDDCRSTAVRPVWSPDGRRILCLSGGGSLYSVDVSSLATQVLAPQISGITGATWSAGGLIAFRATEPAGDTVYSIGSNNQNLTRLVVVQSDPVDSVGAPVWSPDGKNLAIYVLVPNPDAGGPSFAELRIIDVATKQARVVFHGFGLISDLSWSPNGVDLLFELGAGVWTVRSDGQELQQLATGFSPVWSPDGSKIAFSLEADPTGSASIFVMNADGTGVTRVTAGQDDHDPAWSP